MNPREEQEPKGADTHTPGNHQEGEATRGAELREPVEVSTPAPHRSAAGESEVAVEAILVRPAMSGRAARAASVEHLRPPRLGIIHLLAWTAVAAVFLKFNVAMEQIGEMQSQELPRWMAALRQAIAFWFSAFAAGAVVGVCVLLVCKARGVRGRLQPGHWIVLAVAALSLMGRAFWLAQIGLDRLGWNAIPVVLLLIMVLYCVSGAIYACGAGRTIAGLRWRVFLAVAAAAYVLHGGFILASWFLPFRWPHWDLPICPLVLSLMLAVTVVIDVVHRAERDWIHWLGAATVFGELAGSLGWWAWVMVANRLLDNLS